MIMKEYCLCPFDNGYHVAEGKPESKNLFDPSKRIYIESDEQVFDYFSNIVYTNKKKIKVHPNKKVSKDLIDLINDIEKVNIER